MTTHATLEERKKEWLNDIKQRILDIPTDGIEEGYAAQSAADYVDKIIKDISARLPLSQFI